MPVDPSAPAPDPAEVAWQKTFGALGRLFDALDQLDEAGGLEQLAAGWRPRSREKALASLKAAKEAIDNQLGRLKKAGSSAARPRKTA